MSYQVWTKDEFEGWKRKDCEDIEAAQTEIFLALKTGKEPLLTVEVPFSVNIDIKEGKVIEAAKVKAEPGEGAGGKGKGKVRPGDTSSVPELNP